MLGRQNCVLRTYIILYCGRRVVYDCIFAPILNVLCYVLRICIRSPALHYALQHITLLQLHITSSRRVVNNCALHYCITALHYCVAWRCNCNYILLAPALRCTYYVVICGPTQAKHNITLTHLLHICTFCNITRSIAAQAYSCGICEAPCCKQN